MFTSNKVTADFIQEFINHLANAINLKSNVYNSMDNKLTWSIKAKSVNNEMRVIRFYV
jgi:hypothetical protein